MSSQDEPRIDQLEGGFEHQLDAKGRISLPVEFRTLIGLEEGDVIYVTRPVKERCVRLYWRGAWEENDRILNELSKKHPDAVAVARRISRGGVRQMKLDALGRVGIPQNLRTYAELDGKCWVTGNRSQIEIWSYARWEAFSNPDQYESFPVGL